MRSDFSTFSLFAAGLAFFAPLALAGAPGPYGGQWSSSESPVAPSEAASWTNAYSSAVASSTPSSPAVYSSLSSVPTHHAWGTATGGWAPQNTSGPYPTGGMTHKVTPTWHSKAPVASSGAPSVPSSVAPPVSSKGGAAAAMATSFAGLVVAGGVAVLAI